jgi:two-component system chemotaxis response regulator CheY
LDEWLFDLNRQPQLIDTSALRTSSQAIELLDSIFASDRCMRLKHLWAPRALAVDDDQDVLDAVTGSLAHVKLNTSTAHEAREGLQKLYEEKFDLIILDVGLPEVNGLDLCSEIRSMPNHAATPILFLTGAANPETRAQTAIQGGKDFIAKPFRISELGLRALTWALKSQMQAV